MVSQAIRLLRKGGQLLLEQGSERGVDVIIKGGQSFLDPMFTAIKVDPVEGFQFLIVEHLLWI